jgi:hypothetical protein
VLALRRVCPYLKLMVQPVSAQGLVPTARPSTLRVAILWISVGLGAVALLAALALWYRYGTAIFFETIAAGISGCF